MIHAFILQGISFDIDLTSVMLVEPASCGLSPGTEALVTVAWVHVGDPRLKLLDPVFIVGVRGKVRRKPGTTLFAVRPKGLKHTRASARIVTRLAHQYQPDVVRLSFQPPRVGKVCEELEEQIDPKIKANHKNDCKTHQNQEPSKTNLLDTMSCHCVPNFMGEDSGQLIVIP
eukprot:CAMPEP_0184681496 /NCGR_PEP_ID=MMETSP0312-20130426/4485_1 /TAXON_ID=31354 /ORGANISM="Compsopogon coeruleus, Strain SAG 36.94" /LENGTH=171 /DNA_ID=CAMNT_0027132385 /DNA_START=124 /DNA_END=639 /DNA_ORIENTATION=+